MTALAVVLWGALITVATIWSWTGAVNGITGGWGTDPLRFVLGLAYLVLAVVYTLLIGALVVDVSRRRR